MSLEDLSLEQRDELALLMKDLSSNPDTRKDVLRLTKKLRPDLTIPELEIEDNTTRAVTKSQERIDELERKLSERDAMQDLDKRRMELIKKGLARDEAEVGEIEKIMLDKKIADHETAAEYLQWQRQTAAPTPSTGAYNPSGISKFNLGEFWKNPINGARNEAAQALSDLKKSNRPIGI